MTFPIGYEVGPQPGGTLFIAQAVATTNHALSGLPTIDGVTLTDGQIALLTGQVTSHEGGLWAVHSGAWTRPANFPTGADVAGAVVEVEAGSVEAGTLWSLAGAGPIVVDTSSQAWGLQHGTGVSSFNSRSGAVSLAKGDVTGTGLAAADVGAEAQLAVAVAQTGDFLAADAHVYPVDATDGPVTVTIPHTPAGLSCVVIKVDNSAHLVTVRPDSGSLESGGGAYGSITLNSQGAAMTVVADGTDVQVVSPIMYGGDVVFRNLRTLNPSAAIFGDDLQHAGDALGFFGASVQSKQTVTGAKDGNAALASLVTALATYGLITDTTT